MFSGHFCINTKGLSFTLHVFLDKRDEGLAKKIIHWSEHWYFSERSQLNASTVFHLSESTIKRDREIKNKERDRERKKEKERETKREREREREIDKERRERERERKKEKEREKKK